MLIRFLRQKVTDFKKNTQGIVVPIFAAVAFTVVTVVAVAVDVSQFNDIEKELQALADKSVQNALSRNALNTNGISNIDSCTNFFNDGFDNNPRFNTVEKLSFRCDSGNWSASGWGSTQWKLAVKVNIKTPFSGMVGTGYEKTITSRASLNDTKHEVVIVASTAGTMCGNIKKNGDVFEIKKAKKKYKFSIDAFSGKVSAIMNSGTPESEECQKIGFMKAGIESLFTQIKYLQDLRMGFVPFNHTVKFPGFDNNLGFSASYHLPDSLKASVLIEGRDRQGTPENMKIYTDLSRDPTDSDYLPEIVHLEKSHIGANNPHFTATITNAINAIKTTPDTPAWARMDLGMHVAGLMLDKDSATYFNNHDVEPFAESKREEEDLSQYGGSGMGVKKNKVKKIIVLISDGMNAGAVYTNQPAGNFDNNYFYQYEPYNKHLLDVCNVLKNPTKNNVQIFTVIVQGDENDEVSPDIENIMTRCSSDVPYIPEGITYDFTTSNKVCGDIDDENSENEYCYKAKSADNLTDILSSIGKKINKVIRQQ